MSDVLIDQDTMEDIGDSIRSKLGVQTTYLPSEMPSAIMSISGGGGGGSAKYSETVLWSGTQAGLGSIQLSESTNNFDQILILWNANTNSDAYAKYSYLIAVSDIDYTRTYQYQLICTLVSSNYSSYASLHFSDSTNLTIDEYWNGSNSNLRILKVIGIKWETMQTALIYSEEEREVGVWTDGKPLYQKTFNFVNVTTLNSWVSTNHNISNIDKITNYNAIFTRTSDNWTVKADHYEGSSTAYISSNADKTQIHFKIAISSGTYNGSFTIQYTKTTDTAGSGIWTTTGEYAHHYSTTERVIGTWTDGKTLYEKCIQTRISTPTTLGGDLKFGTVNISSEVSNVDMLFVDTSRSYYIDENDHKRGFLGAYGEPEKPGIAFTTYYSRSNLNAVFTIQYTKTT